MCDEEYYCFTCKKFITPVGTSNPDKSTTYWCIKCHSTIFVSRYKEE